MAMILRQFPGTSRSTQENEFIFSCFGAQNILVQARSKEISFTEHTAPLSIKAAARGREMYEIDSRPIAVEAGTFLIVNETQPYASYISSTEPVESFCLFFRSALAAEALTVLHATDEMQLNDPAYSERTSQPFFQNLHHHDELISPLLARLRQRVLLEDPPSLWLDERFHELMEAMLRLQARVSCEVDELPALRRVTREELYRRLHRAKDYLNACYAEPLTLADLARVACLSQAHFLRLFKQAFRVTPHQYLRQVRLQKARQLLMNQNLSVTEICLNVGFENLSSFSRLFRQTFGFSPRQMRSPHDPAAK